MALGRLACHVEALNKLIQKISGKNCQPSGAYGTKKRKVAGLAHNSAQRLPATIYRSRLTDNRFCGLFLIYV